MTKLIFAEFGWRVNGNNLHIASECGHLDILEWASFAPDLLSIEDSEVEKVLRDACKNGYLDTAQQLKASINCERKSLKVKKALAAACTNGHLHVAEWLRLHSIWKTMRHSRLYYVAVIRTSLGGWRKHLTYIMKISWWRYSAVKMSSIDSKAIVNEIYRAAVLASIVIGFAQPSHTVFKTLVPKLILRCATSLCQRCISGWAWSSKTPWSDRGSPGYHIKVSTLYISLCYMYTMASIMMMVGSAIVNAIRFGVSNYLFSTMGRGDADT